MRGAQISAGYTLSALGKPDVSQQAALFHWPLADDVDIYLQRGQTDTWTLGQPAKVTVPS